MNIIDGIIQREGGYVDHPDDRGGPTNMGITQATLASWRGREVTADDVRNLTESEARKIYRRKYIERPGYDKIIDDRLRECVVDAAVHSGPTRATRWLQQVLGTLPDGICGHETLEAANTAFADQTIERYLNLRAIYLQELAERKPSQRVFLKGWMNRLRELGWRETDAPIHVARGDDVPAPVLPKGWG